jgi:hypothetical protein
VKDSRVNGFRVIENSAFYRFWIVLLAFIVLHLVGSVSCNQPFDPRAPLDQQMVLYTVLSTDRDAQFVRVEKNYMPSGFDPTEYALENAVNDAIVTITQSAKLFQCRDTVLSRPDTTRYASPLRLYALAPFTPQRGTKYNILVQSRSLGMASSAVTIPQTPTLTEDYSAIGILQNTITRQPSDLIKYSVLLSNESKGYMARLYIYYDVLKGSEWVEERVEVPAGTWSDDVNYYGIDKPLYPQMSPSPQTGLVSIAYKNGFLQTVVKDLTTARYANNKIIYKWVVLAVLQAEQNLYNYFVSIQEYRDARSIRLDEPMYTRVNGGLGLAGGYTLDSLTILLPDNFAGNRK